MSFGDKVKEYKEEHKKMREEQKEESGSKKILIMVAAILALVYTGMFWFFFKLHDNAARSRNTYACSF